MRNVLFALVFLISGCTHTGSSSHAIDAVSINGNLDTENSEIANFNKICVANGQSAEEQAAAAKAAGWEIADKKSLESVKLTNLRKTILEIPGGGARIRESQRIFVQTTEGAVSHLVIEEKFDQETLISATCDLYSNAGEFFKTCATLGKALNRAPDRNHRYKSTGSHFISWNGVLRSKIATVTCQQTPKAVRLPYEGTVLKLAIDHQTPPQR